MASVRVAPPEMGLEPAGRAGLAIDFRICDVASTPFDDGEFTFVVCQQGLQFFPDEQAALTELRRVAVNGTRFVFTVRNRPSPLCVAVADSLRVHGGAELAKRSLAPFSWTGAETAASRRGEAGCVDIDIQELEIDRVPNDPTQSIPSEIMGNPVGPSVVRLGQAVFDTVDEEVLDATERYRHGNRLVIPQHTSHLSNRRLIWKRPRRHTQRSETRQSALAAIIAHQAHSRLSSPRSRDTTHLAD